MSNDDVARIEEQIKTLFSNDTRFEKCVEEIRTDIKQLANRLPVWATLLVALLTAACGWFAAK